MVKSKVEQAVIDALERVASDHGVDIVDVELTGATKAPCVRVRIEGADGSTLTLDDVAANTAWVGEVVEAVDPVSGSYTLEVSTPGLDRPLRRPRDFERFSGSEVELTEATNLKELGADSFDLLELVTALEDEFSLTFDDDAVGTIATVGEVVAAIERAQ